MPQPKRRSRTRSPGRTLDVVTTAPVPPDGGWGWVVVMSSFFISVIVDGVCYTFGIFFNVFLLEFGESKSTTSWASSVLNGTYLSVGVIVSALANKYGCRRVAIVGAVISSVSFFASTFSPNIGIFIFLYGFMGGLGFGLMYLPALVMVGYYFEERRAFATGVAVCGSGIGAFVFAPLCEYLMDTYSWKGAMWILSGIVLNGVIFASFYRPLDPIITIVEPTDEEVLLSAVHKPIVRKHVTSSKHSLEMQKSRRNVPDLVVTSAESSSLLENIDTCGTATKIKGSNTEMEDLSWDDAPSPRNRCMTHDPTTLRVFGSAADNRAKANNYKLKVSDVYGLDNTNRKRQQEQLLWLAKSQDFRSRDHSAAPVVHGFLDVARPLYRKDIFYSGSVYHLPEYLSVSSMNDYVKSVTKIPQEEDTKLSRCLRWMHLPKDARSILEDMLDLSILKSVTFDVYAFSCFLAMIGFFVPFIYMPPLAIDMKIDKQRAAFLVSILGITNTVGRVLTGVVCDRSWVDCILVNNVGMIIAGLATVAVPFYNTYWLMATYCAVFGICISPFVSLRTVIVVELLGLDKLSNSFGFITMFQGVSSFVGIPIAGAICDVTGGYTAGFYMAGTVIVFSGAMSMFLRRLKRWENARDAVKGDVKHTEIAVHI